MELLLAKGADPAKRDRQGATPLENAVRGRHADAVGCARRPAAAAQAGPLLLEAALKGQTEIADLLISKGADVNARDRSGRTPLHAAALKGKAAVARLLLDHGAAVDAAR